jgi:rod shape determining protein RodA
MTFFDRLKALHWGMILIVVMLACIGTAMQFAVDGGSWAPDAGMHIQRFAFALPVMILLATLPLGWWMKIAYPLYGFALVLLIAVELVGKTKLGAQRWLDVGPTDIQPSELMKIAIVLAIARYYHNMPSSHGARWASMLIPLTMAAIPTALVFHQPDLGTGLLVFAAGLGMIFVAGLPWRTIAMGAAGLAVIVPVFFTFGMHDYQRERVLTFLQPDRDPMGEGYHITQSVIAIGSGGFGGKGFLEGSQAQNDFLPEKQTDFIFAALAEELGFLGAGGTLWLFGILIALGLYTAREAKATFARFAALGVVITLTCYVVINIGMVMGLLPVVGVPLPLISYGGTAMFTMLTGIALLLAAWRTRDNMRLEGS